MSNEHLKSKYPSPQMIYTGGAGDDRRMYIFAFVMFVIILIATAILAFLVSTIPDAQCERKMNGYPLISFQIDGSGDEINCRYGTETD